MARSSFPSSSGGKSSGGGVRWGWRCGPCALPLSLCVWHAAVVACGAGGVRVSVLVAGAATVVLGGGWW
jgi:hypothetical protein